MGSEKIFEEKVKRFLESEGCWYIKYWGGGGFTKAGVPDLLVCCNGYFLGIELKAPKGRHSQLQIRTLREIIKANGLAFLLYPKDFEDFKNFIRELKEDVPVDTLLDIYGFVTEWWYKYDV